MKFFSRLCWKDDTSTNGVGDLKFRLLGGGGGGGCHHSSSDTTVIADTAIIQGHRIAPLPATPSKKKKQKQKKENNNECDEELFEWAFQQQDPFPFERIVGQGSADADSNGDPEEYWYNQVVPNLSQGQRDLVAQELFCRLWTERGQAAAEDFLCAQTSPQKALKLAEKRFNLGCELWAQDQHTQALWELEQSRAIREAHSQQSLLFVRGGTNRQVDTLQVEAIAQLFYALGAVHLSLSDHTMALMEFCRALQASGMGLGMDFHLTEACQYMIRTVLLTMGRSNPKIHAFLQQLSHDMHKETEGDKLYESEALDQALLEYANLMFLTDQDPLTQARVRTKMAIIFEEKGDYLKAQELWATIMSLYSLCPGMGETHPMTRKAMTNYVKNRVQVQENKCKLEKMEI